MNIILILIVVGVIAFAVISYFVGLKNRKLEKAKRKEEVKNQIKKYLKAKHNLKNIFLEFEKVAARQGKIYKYRDIFDVIVDIYNAKDSKLIATKAFEIEGMSEKVDKKTTTTCWVVNFELDLEDTRRQIGIIEGSIKLSKEELKERRAKLRQQEKEHFQKLQNFKKPKLKKEQKLTLEEQLGLIEPADDKKNNADDRPEVIRFKP